jgi:hypothetical protein
MGEWANQPISPLGGVISSQSLESIGGYVCGIGGTIPGSAGSAWFAASAAVFIPFRVYEPITVTRGFVYNGSVVSGNVDVGIYLPNGARIVSTGSTAQAGTSALQTLDITDTSLAPGLYYMALALDNTTGTVARFIVSQAARLTAAGVYTMTSAFALPATVTFATAATITTIPYYGFTTRSFV